MFGDPEVLWILYKFELTKCRVDGFPRRTVTDISPFIPLHKLQVPDYPKSRWLKIHFQRF